MTEAESVRAQQWFENHFVGSACIMCSRLGTLKLGKSLSLADTSKRDTAWHLYIVVECALCGHVLLYNAETIGVRAQKLEVSTSKPAVSASELSKFRVRG